MPLDDLTGVIEKLQRRIEKHGASLRANETRTRLALIDPLLCALGWDTADPDVVMPEYRVDVGWADYALQRPGTQPIAVIEAKRLGSVVDHHLEQAVGYCIEQGIAYAGITDGNHWQLYRTFDPVPLADKRVLDVHIGDAPAHQSALKLLLLWRPNLASGLPTVAKEPILRMEPELATVPNTSQPAEIPEARPGWIALAEYNLPAKSPPPKAIRFTDGKERPLSHWHETLAHTVEWLHSKELLTTANAPVKSSQHRYAVSTEPVHPNGDSFDKPISVNGTPFVISLGLNAKQIRQYTTKLLQHCGVNPAEVFVQTAP